MAKRTKKPKRPSIWEENPYGQTDRRGNPDMWRAAFGEAMSGEEAEEILGDDSPWVILGIAAGEVMAAIKKAYRRLALHYHPDRYQNEPEAKQKEMGEMFKKVHAAYVKLGGR